MPGSIVSPAMSFRDRFLTRPVARAITSPTAILATGAGAGLGAVALGPLGAVLGGIIGFVIRVAAAIPKAAEGGRIDPLALSEPWNRLVSDALAARAQFRDATRRTRAGPVADRLASIGNSISDSVNECWEVAQGGHALSQARKRIDDFSVRRQFDEVQSIRSRGTDATLDATITSLQAQLDTAARMDATIADTQNRLRLLNARLDEAVTRSIELSVAQTDSGELSTIDTAVGDILTEMEALRAAVSEVRSLSTGTALPDLGAMSAQPPTGQPGFGESSDGSASASPG